MFQTRGLSKRYGSVTAVEGVTFAAAAGQTVGLLGPNGAGKTTTVSMIAGLVQPDAGDVLIEGRPIGGDTNPVKRRLGLVTQELALLDDLPARDNLLFFAALYGLDGAAARRSSHEALALVGLEDRAGDKVRTFSGGMKRRLNLAAALLHDPQVLLLDEPTVGVDPQSRNAIFDNLELLKARGKTLLYTTHYMEEAERLCDRVVILDKGRVIANDTLPGLYRLLPASNLLRVELEDRGAAVALDEVRQIAGVTTAALSAGVLEVGVSDLALAAPAVLTRLTDRGHRYHHVVTERPDLETVFLALTGRTLRDQ